MYNPYSSRRHSQWNGRSAYHQDRRFVNDDDFNSAAGLRNMSRSEREEVWRRAQYRVQDPYSFPRQRSGAYATMGNIHAVEDADRRERNRRHRNTGVDDVANQMSRMTVGDRGARGARPDRNIRWGDQYAAPEPPRINPRNAEYYLDRAYRPHNTYQDNYNDAYRYINGRHPDRRTEPVRSRHEPREYTRLNGGRNRDRTNSRWDRVRNWF